MNSAERRAVFSLAGISSLRIFGLFLLLPVLSVYAGEYPGSTPFMVGLAIGIYGLTQALLQIPFGLLSDRIGRKPVIAMGLLIFALGSLIAAFASSIEWLIIGRAIQGGGAVSAAVLALTADLTREEQRSKAMAIIGIGIGSMFLLSITIAPPLAAAVGISGLFVITMISAGVAIIVLFAVVPTPTSRVQGRASAPVLSQMGEVLANKELLRLDIGIFVLHLLMTAVFVVLPGEISRLGQLEPGAHWKVYLPIIFLSAVAMGPVIMQTTKTGRNYRIFQSASGLLPVALLILMAATASDGSFVLLLAGLWLYFFAFNILESMFPSLVSRVAPIASKGTASGVYNSMQFLGIFVGGVLGGYLAGLSGTHYVFLAAAMIGALWFMLCLLTPAFRLYSSRTINFETMVNSGNPESHREALIDKLRNIRGVMEVTVLEGEPLAYLKVNDRDLDTDALNQLTQT